jgi:multidrug efflux pump subunit AcrB
MWGALAIFGVLSYTVFLQKQGFPAVDIPVSVVQATYFVDDKSRVDSELTEPIVDAVGEIEGVKSTIVPVLLTRQRL